MKPGISVVIPTIAPRRVMLRRAMDSITSQILWPQAVIVEADVGRLGAAATRTIGLNKVKTEWVAFLDDDDEMLPEHLSTLVRLQEATGADLAHSWFEVVGGTDPFPQHRGRAFDLANPHQIPITVLVRTEALREVGGFLDPDWPAVAGDPGTDADGNRAGEDFRTWIRLAQAGAQFATTPEITWIWHHHQFNTSGLPGRWT